MDHWRQLYSQFGGQEQSGLWFYLRWTRSNDSQQIRRVVLGAWANLDRYNETNTYDFQGNILTLVRKGYISSGNYNTVDNLTYTYDGLKIHQLNSIADASGSALGFPAASGSYTYDANGNQISDGAKGFTAITYNHLNLPTKFTQGANTIEIQYDAAGRKLKKILSSGTTKSYIGNIEYVGSTVEAIYHADGRARNNVGTYVYEYVIKDHLGDTRVAFTNTSGTIALIQENHYYPFGMQQGGWTAEPSPTNAYKYNGKELNVDFGLNLSDYGARWYDAGVGRWTSVDGMSDHASQMNKSTYAYAWDNPVNLTDPDGNCPTCITGALGALAGALIGGGIELATQLYKNGSVNDWKAVGGSALQGGITGGVAGLTGGTSLLTTAGVGAAANAVGGAASNAVQGKDITVESVVKDAAIGAGAAVGGALIGKAVQGGKGAVAGAENGTSKVTNTIKNETDYVVTPRGETIKIPNSASGPVSPNKGSGMMYQGGSGGKGMNERVTGVRIMDANSNQGRRVNYMNREGQTVDPSSGRTISNQDPRGHTKLKDY